MILKENELANILYNICTEERNVYSRIKEIHKSVNANVDRVFSGEDFCAVTVEEFLYKYSDFLDIYIFSDMCNYRYKYITYKIDKCEFSDKYVVYMRINYITTAKAKETFLQNNDRHVITNILEMQKAKDICVDILRKNEDIYTDSVYDIEDIHNRYDTVCDDVYERFFELRVLKDRCKEAVLVARKIDNRVYISTYVFTSACDKFKYLKSIINDNYFYVDSDMSYMIRTVQLDNYINRIFIR